MTGSPSKSERVLEQLRKTPHAKNKDIAALVGCTSPLVAKTRKRYGIHRAKSIRATVIIKGANAVFLDKFAESANITAKEAINAIITDARIEDES